MGNPNVSSPYPAQCGGKGNGRACRAVSRRSSGPAGQQPGTPKSMCPWAASSANCRTTKSAEDPCGERGDAYGYVRLKRQVFHSSFGSTDAYELRDTGKVKKEALAASGHVSGPQPSS